MTDIDLTTAANILIQRRLTGTTGDRLPLDARPQTLDDAIALQQAVTAHWCETQDDTIGGWKCLLPPEGKLIVGPIYTRTIDSVAPVALWPQKGVARIEPELAFFIQADLPPRDHAYSRAEIDAAIGRTHMALELIFCRYNDSSQCEFPEMLGDGLVNQGLFIGPEVDSSAAAQSAEMAIHVNYTDHQQTFAGKHPNQDPRAPLYWLVNYLREQGVGLEAGQAIITGSFAGVIEVPLDTDIHIEYANLGAMQVNFNARKAQ